MTSETPTGSGDKLTWPASTRAMSSTSLMSPSRCFPPLTICVTHSASRGLSSRISSSCPNPRIALSGVRSSWLMRERNSLLARFAASASFFACSSPTATSCKPAETIMRSIFSILSCSLVSLSCVFSCRISVSMRWRSIAAANTLAIA